MAETASKIKSHISGPRFMGLKQILWDAAYQYDLELKILDEDKGWFGTTVFFEVEGKLSDLNAFANYLHSIADCRKIDYMEKHNVKGRLILTLVNETLQPVAFYVGELRKHARPSGLKRIRIRRRRKQCTM